MRRLLASLPFLFVAPIAGEAHAVLDAAVPAVGSSGPSPAAIRLTFTEAVEPLFSTLTMINREGDVIDLPKPAADPSDTKVLVIKLPTPLPPGIYYVEWHALAVDTHRSQGHFRFTVTP